MCGKPINRPRRLLRARPERPRGRRAAEQRDELASPHSMTSSAATSRPGGTVRPSAFAVLRLMTSSYLVGVCNLPFEDAIDVASRAPELVDQIRRVGHQAAAGDHLDAASAQPRSLPSSSSTKSMSLFPGEP